MSIILQQFGRGAMLAVLALTLSQSVVTAAGPRIGGGGKVSRAIGGGMKSIGGAKIPAIRGSSGSRIASSPRRSSILQPSANKSSFPVFNNFRSKSIPSSNTPGNLTASSRLGSDSKQMLHGDGIPTNSNFNRSSSIMKPPSSGSDPSTIGRLNSGSSNNSSGNDSNRIPRNQQQQIPRNEPDRIPRIQPTERPERPVVPELPELADAGPPGRSLPRGPSIRNPLPGANDSPSTGLPANPSPDAPPSNRVPVNPPSNRVPVNPTPVDPPATVYPRDPLPINPPGGGALPFPGIDVSVGIGAGAYPLPIATEAPLRQVPINETADVQPTEAPADTANEFAGVDLILEDVRANEPATLVAGPSYRVKFRNQGLQTSGKFRVRLQAVLEGVPSNSYATLYMDGLAGGQAHEATLRLPISSMNLTMGKLATGLANARRPFSHLIVVIDVDNTVSENDEANNSATIERAALER